MKAKITLLSCVGLAVCSLAAFAQDNAPATTNAPLVSETKTAAVVGEVVESPSNAPPASEIKALGPNEIIPLIQYVDVPLTTAIENLARQANLNYILDPKIGYGQLGPDGKPLPQPSISVRWENLTAEQALGAVLNNYDLQLVEDPKTKITRISKRDPAAPDPLAPPRVIQLKFASVSNILTAVQSTLTDKRSKTFGDLRTSQLVVVATEKELVAVEELVERLDTQSKQVLIEGQLLEVSMTPSSKKGINWSGTFKEQNATFGNGIINPVNSRATTTIPGTPTTTTLPGGRTITTTPRSSESTTLETILGSGGLSLNTFRGLTPNIGFLNADGLRATLSFFNEQADTRVLSTPRTVTLDNEPTFIEVGTMYPIVNVSAGTVQTAGGSQVSYTNLTLRLEVTPSISANNYVNLKVHPSIMRLGPYYESTVAGVKNQVPSFYKRDMETRVLIPSGNTLVLGGLLQDELNSSSTKVPLLGDIPLLGYAFRSKGKDRDKRNLVVFITPTIVQDEDFQPSKSTFLKTPVPTGESLEPDWSPFDSTTPVDWSKPEPLNFSKPPAQQPVFDESLVAPKAP